MDPEIKNLLDKISKKCDKIEIINKKLDKMIIETKELLKLR